MGQTHPAPEVEAEFVEIGEQRRSERRWQDRRTLRQQFDLLFAVSLIRQIEQEVACSPRSYGCTLPSRRGIKLNVWA